jgi:hypothetical protein
MNENIFMNMNKGMKVTEEWILKNTSCGALSKGQALALGLEWPLRHGWKQWIVGREISEQSARDFEFLYQVQTAARIARRQKSRSRPEVARFPY